MNRITIDIDQKEIEYLTCALIKLEYELGIPKKLEVRNSRKKGYHIIWWHTHRLSRKREWEIRVMAGDDPKRIAWEKSRGNGVPRNVLFKAVEP